MPSFSETQAEILSCMRQLSGQEHWKNTAPKKIRTAANSIVRRGYLRKLSNLTGRNVISYYSGFLQSTDNSDWLSIDDNDMNAFMACVHGLDRTRGLDLILHTPGGDIAATEAIVDYLHFVFGNDIRCLVPQLALSAGTMIACASREILMGNHSSLGPIDPQIEGVSTQALLEAFTTARRQIAESPSTVALWRELFSKISPMLLIECQHATMLSQTLVKEWLEKGMFSELGETLARDRARCVLDYLNNHSATKTHRRHISWKVARDIGLKVTRLEDCKEGDFQDCVLTIHHCYVDLFQTGWARKVVENHSKESRILMLE